MQTSLTFKNLDSSDHLKSYVGEKLDRLDKYLDNPAEANVVLSVEKFRHIAEINIIGDRLKLNGREETNDMYQAIDMVIDKLEKQIKKNKQKSRERRSGGKNRLIDHIEQEEVATDETDDVATASADQGAEIRIQSIEYKPMDVDEAAMQLDLSSDNFIVFTNAITERVNVIYRRKDGDLGLIQPNT